MAKKRLDTYWWKKSNDELADSLFSICGYLDGQQEYVFNDNLRNAKLYGNLDILGLNAYQYTPTLQNQMPQARLTYNVIKSVIDTACNKISKNKPRPYFLTSGGDWGKQQLAKKMQAFSDALFYVTDFYDLGVQCFRDGCIFDTGGFIKIFRENDEVKAERVLSQELKFDDVEAFYGVYRNLYQTKVMNREVLLEMFPSKKNLILNAPEVEVKIGGSQSIGDHVSVVEAWHLNGKNGRHSIAVQNGVLSNEEWKRDYFPFVSFQWTRPLLGARGQSLASELTGIQVEINRTLKTIQQIMRLVVPKLFVEKSSKVVYSHLNNEIGGIIEFTGTKPQYDFLQQVPPDLIRHLQELYQRAYELAGISQLAAQSQKPSGLDSGKALREFNDIESERFVLKGMDYEKLYLNATKQMLRIVQDIAKDEGSFKLKAKMGKGFEEIDWKEINLDEEEYQIHSYPTSFLSQTPAGRLQDVTELVQAGYIEQQDGMRLLNFPDLESHSSLATAASDDIMMIIDQMLEKGIYQSPEPYEDLAYGIQKVRSAYLRAKVNKAPEEKLELLRRWIDTASQMIAPPPAPAMPEMPVDPMGVPEQPPVSDLMPIQGG